MTEPIQFTLPKRWLILLATSFVVSVLLFFSSRTGRGAHAAHYSNA